MHESQVDNEQGLVTYELPPDIDKCIVNGNVSIEQSPYSHVGDKYYIYGPVTYLHQKDKGEDVTSTPCVLDVVALSADKADLHNHENTNNNSKVCIVAEQKFKIRKLHILVAAGLLLVATAAALTTIFILNDRTSSDTDNEDDSNGILTMVGRQEWNATNISIKFPPLIQPTKFVVVAHTSGRICKSVEECSFVMRYIQDWHLKRGFGDIGYNFLIGGDGRVYVGRDWEVQGRHTKPFNDKAIGISFIGTFMTRLPPKKALNACKLLLEEGVKLRKLASNFTIYAQKQLIATESPGAQLIEEIRTWPHWSTYDPLKTQPNYTSITPLQII